MPAQQWERTLRRQIKDNHGFGWNVIAQSGKTKLTRVHEDGTKSAKVLPIDWKATNSVQILHALARIRYLMEIRNLSLAEAVRLDTSELAVPSRHSGVAQQGWSTVVQEYLKAKEGLRSSTLSDLRTRLNRLLVCVDQKPKPRDSTALLKRYAQLFFSDMESGSEGRKRNVQSIVAFLHYAVDRAGAHQCWLPPEKSFTAELIGVSAIRNQASLTPPIKSPELAALLDQMEADGRHDLHLATALISLFGLRPSELAVLSVKAGRLYCGAIKRNAAPLAQKPRPPRLCLPLDIEGRTGEGMKALQLFTSGLVKLPRPVLNEISKVEEKQSFKQVGHAYGQLLRRYTPWQNLVRSNPEITPYSLRHSWAWRCHVCSTNPLNVRTASALMGHLPTVHMSTYGAWVNESSLEAAVEHYNKGLVIADN